MSKERKTTRVRTRAPGELNKEEIKVENIRATYLQRDLDL